MIFFFGGMCDEDPTLRQLKKNNRYALLLLAAIMIVVIIFNLSCLSLTTKAHFPLEKIKGKSISTLRNFALIFLVNTYTNSTVFSRFREQQLNMAPKGIHKPREASSIFVPLSIAAKANWKLNEIFCELSLCMHSIICTEAHILQ